MYMNYKEILLRLFFIVVILLFTILKLLYVLRRLHVKLSFKESFPSFPIFLKIVHKILLFILLLILYDWHYSIKPS